MREEKIIVTVWMKLEVEEDADISEVVNEMNYSFEDTIGKATVIATDILNVERDKD